MSKKDKKFIQQAHDRFKMAEEYYQDQRRLGVEDLKFAMADSDNQWQWPKNEREGRETSNKVVLTVNQTAQHCNQVINAIRQNRPSIKVSPSDDYADKETASILGGLIRNIQAQSSADDAHDLAAEHSTYSGEGFWRVITEYESQTSFNQVISIKPIQNPHLVLIDPSAQELDRSDAEWGFVFEDIPREEAEKEYRGIKVLDWGPEQTGWMTEDTIRIAEYFYCDKVPDTLYLLSDGETVLKSEVGEIEGFVDSRETERKDWKWCKIVGGIDKPVDKKDWLGEYLPIISVVGKEINVDGEMIRKGLVRDLKDPARMVNYAYSETVQTMALQNKAPYTAASEAIEGHEDSWNNANIENLSYLPYNAFDAEGNPIPPPQRQMPTTMPAAHIQLLTLSTEQMRASSGQQNANFGIRSEAASGIGIQRLKAQGEVATFHFPDNLARGLAYEAKVVIDLIQKYYDTERVVRILGIDGAQEEATLDPQMQEPYREETIEDKIQKIFNPTLGRYDVTVDTGPSFHTQRQEAAAHLNDLAAKVPGFMQLSGDLVMKAQDFHMADKIAERLEKALPKELRDEVPGQGNIPPEVQAQMQDMGQKFEQMLANMQQLEAENDQLKQGEAVKIAEISSKERIEQEKILADQRTEIIRIESEKEIANAKNETTITKTNLDNESKEVIAEGKT